MLQLFLHCAYDSSQAFVQPFAAAIPVCASVMTTMRKAACNNGGNTYYRVAYWGGLRGGGH